MTLRSRVDELELHTIEAMHEYALPNNVIIDAPELYSLMCAWRDIVKEQRQLLDRAMQGLEYYTVKPEYSTDEQGRRVTRFVPQDNGTELFAQRTLKEIRSKLDGDSDGK